MIKNLPVPFCSLLHVKNCVLHIDISVEIAFDSCLKISKFLKSGNTTENEGNTLSKLGNNSMFSVWRIQILIQALTQTLTLTNVLFVMFLTLMD